MFCDIAEYSTLAERVGPDVSHRLVTDVLERVTACVDAHAGSVVDFYGDGVLVMWNAPVTQPDHAERACRTALAIQAEIPELTNTWAGVLGGRLALRCTLNTGLAMVGNAGTLRRVKYGPMGHTINLAQRVQAAGKFFGLPILLTASTLARLGGAPMSVRRLGKAHLAGIVQATELFELHATDSSWAGCRNAFEKALAHFEAGAWCDACSALQATLAWQPDQLDLASLHLLGRAVECLKAPPARFSSVWNLTGK
jgi:adenylate cyclase